MSQLTGFTTHREMKKHNFRGYVENGVRISAIMKFLKEDGILKDCKFISCKKASKKMLSLVHSPKYIDEILELQFMTQTQINKWAKKQNSIKANTSTPSACRLAVGGVVKLTEMVWENKLKNAFCAVRMPGHHAHPELAQGFCFFNNVAIAATNLLKNYNAKRILIFDWDCHHGDSTQQIFYSNPNVLFISMHRYKKHSFFPGDDSALPKAIGKGQGKGYNVNVAFKKQNLTDNEYLYTIQSLLLPIIQQFVPEIILVSAGFDSVAGDELGKCLLTPTCYAKMTQILMKECSRIVVALEGGYNLASLGECVGLVISTLQNNVSFSVKTNSKKVSKSVLQSIEETRSFLAPYWNI